MTCKAFTDVLKDVKLGAKITLDENDEMKIKELFLDFSEPLIENNQYVQTMYNDEGGWRYFYYLDEIPTFFDGMWVSCMTDFFFRYDLSLEYPASTINSMDQWDYQQPLSYELQPDNGLLTYHKIYVTPFEELPIVENISLEDTFFENSYEYEYRTENLQDKTPNTLYFDRFEVDLSLTPITQDEFEIYYSSMFISDKDIPYSIISQLYDLADLEYAESFYINGVDSSSTAIDPGAPKIYDIGFSPLTITDSELFEFTMEQAVKDGVILDFKKPGERLDSWILNPETYKNLENHAYWIKLIEDPSITEPYDGPTIAENPFVALSNWFNDLFKNL